MPPTILFGCANVGGKYSTVPAVQELLNALKSVGIKHLDTAARYGSYGGRGQPGDSEKLLGAADAASQGFTIDSKILYLGNGEPEFTFDKTETSTLTTLERLKVHRVHTLYFHAPDPLTPLEEQARVMDAQFKAGRMEKLGISNFPPEMLREYIDICRNRGYILPSVYQGQYNLINRQREETLFPLLRKEGMKFAAYSPLATGYLTVSETKPGNSMHEKLYGEEGIAEAVRKFKGTVEGLGVSATEAALRWTFYHSALRNEDMIILGASSKEQIVNSMDMVRKGPLVERVVKAVEQVWEDVKTLKGT